MLSLTINTSNHQTICLPYHIICSSLSNHHHHFPDMEVHFCFQAGYSCQITDHTPTDQKHFHLQWKLLIACRYGPLFIPTYRRTSYIWSPTPIYKAAINKGSFTPFTTNRGPPCCFFFSIGCSFVFSVHGVPPSVVLRNLGKLWIMVATPQSFGLTDGPRRPRCFGVEVIIVGVIQQIRTFDKFPLDCWEKANPLITVGGVSKFFCFQPDFFGRWSNLINILTCPTKKIESKATPELTLGVFWLWDVCWLQVDGHQAEYCTWWFKDWWFLKSLICSEDWGVISQTLWQQKANVILHKSPKQYKHKIHMFWFTYIHTYNTWFRSDTGVWSSVVEHDFFKFANYISKSCCRIIPPAGRMVFNCCCPAHYEPHFGGLSTIRPNHLVSSHWLNQTQLLLFVWLHEWLHFSPLLPYHAITERPLEKLTPLWLPATKVAHYFTWYMGMCDHHVRSLAFINLFHGFSSSALEDVCGMRGEGFHGKNSGWLSRRRFFMGNCRENPTLLANCFSLTFFQSSNVFPETRLPWLKTQSSQLIIHKAHRTNCICLPPIQSHRAGRSLQEWDVAVYKLGLYQTSWWWEKTKLFYQFARTSQYRHLHTSTKQSVEDLDWIFFHQPIQPGLYEQLVFKGFSTLPFFVEIFVSPAGYRGWLVYQALWWGWRSVTAPRPW